MTKIQTLPVMEMFHTIQGEGYNTGTPAFFIRLAGCDVGCVWCDVKESWDANQHSVISVEKIIEEVESSGAQHVVITGGEPLMYDLNVLCAALKERNKKIFLETSGAYPVSGKFDWICVSPKKFKPMIPGTLAAADELKVIVFNKSDFEWAKANAEKVSTSCKLYLQPEWSVSEKILPQIIDFVKNNPRWKISLQTHKWMQIP